MTQYEIHIQCDCGGSLIVIASPSDDVFEKTLYDRNFNIWQHEETLSFRHRGNFQESCIDFRNQVIRLMQQDLLQRSQGVLGTFVSREIHG